MWLSGNQTDVPQLGHIEYINLESRQDTKDINVSTQDDTSPPSYESTEVNESISIDEPNDDIVNTQGILSLCSRMCIVIIIR